MPKIYTNKQLHELINSLSALPKEQKKAYLNMIPRVPDNMRAEFAKLFEDAKEAYEKAEQQHLPKIIKLYKEKMQLIKDFVNKKLGKYLKKAEKAENVKEQKKAEKLLEQL